MKKLWVVALILLAVGFLNVARGLDHPGTHYRNWTLHHGAYSDILALSGDRYLHGQHPLPYVHDRIEYPVVMGLLLWLPSYVPGGQPAYLAVETVILAGCLLVALRVLKRTPGANPWLLAATPALATYGLLNWDLAGIALLLLAFESTNGGLLGLGITTKLFPAAAIPAFLRRGRRWVLPAIAVLILGNLPFAIANYGNWRWFFTFNSTRPVDYSVWNALSITSVRFVNVASLAIVGIAAVYALRRAGTPARDRLGLAVVVTTWLAFNKVSSPQYALWVFAVAALVGAPWRIWAALVAGAMLDFWVELWRYPQHSLTLRPMVAVSVWLRMAAMLWLIAWCVWRLERGHGSMSRATRSRNAAAAPSVTGPG